MNNPKHNFQHDGNCDWCKSSEYPQALPDAFCWTKMQTEAGQTLNTIFCRKELERAAGGGLFYWGIGNSLKASMAELVRRTSKPEVLFSVMRAKPKQVDISPSSILIWTEYIDEAGCLRPVPEHSLLLSRGETASGVKKRCYALVCYSQATLTPSPLASLNLSHFRNLGGSRGGIGFSQVSAIIEHIPNNLKSVGYDVSLRGVLKAPYVVTLAGSKTFLDKDRAAMEHFLTTKPSPKQWLTFIKELRRHYDSAAPSEQHFTLSSE